MNANIRIDPEFEGKIPPLTDKEFAQLEENIVSAGEVYEPIVIWNGTIVDGHNRWKIVQKHPEIVWKTRNMDFADKWEAFDWMYKNQLGRRNLTEEQRQYLIGKLYEARKNTQRGAPFGNNNRSKQFGQNDRIEQRRLQRDGTAGEIGKEFGLKERTVRRAEQYAKGIDAIREANPELADSILKSEKRINKQEIQDIGQAKPEERIQMVDDLASCKKKKCEGATKQNREECAEIRNLIGEITEEVPMDYTIESLTKQISVNADSFIRSLSNLMMDHSDLCNEYPDEVIQTIEESIIKRIEQIKEKLNDGTHL